MTQRPDDIARSSATDAYHVSEAIADAAATKVSDLHLARAAEVMKLAYGVGISTDQSRALVAAKLEEWDRQVTNDVDIVTWWPAQQPGVCGV